MRTKISAKIKNNAGSQTYVVEGATLACTLGGNQNRLQIPNEPNIYINGKKQANIADHIGGFNIMSFGPCSRSIPPPPCIMATANKWVNGKPDVFVNDEMALLNTSINLCACGGIISVVDDGQGSSVPVGRV